MVSSLGLAVRTGEGVRPCNGLALFLKGEDRIGDWLDITRPDGSLGLGVRAGEKAVFAASDGVFLELSLGLGVTGRGEVGVFNEETEDRVLIEKEDGGDEPKLIKARLAPKPGSRSGLELGSGGVWVTGKPVLEQASGWTVGKTGVKPGMDPCMGAMGVEVCSGPGSYPSSFFNNLFPTSPCFSVLLKVCPDEAGDGMGRELGAEADVLPMEALTVRFVRGSGLGPCLE